MKYSELHRKLKKVGCYPTGKQVSGHPEWYSPITKRFFITSNHEKEEVATGTLKNIKKSAGIE